MKLLKKENVAELPGIKGPGVAPIRITEIEDDADQYIHERDKRCAMTPKEVAAKEKLIETLHKHASKIGKDKDGSIVYRYEENVIILKPGKEQLKVKDVSKDGGEED